MKEIYYDIKRSCKQAKLIVVSKKRSLEEIMSYYNAGVRDFGENRVQDLIEKADALPKDIHWHLIGHLQRNKVKAVLPYVTMIHSVESPELLKVLDKEARALNKKIDILIQFNIAEEATKSGLNIEEAEEFVKMALAYSSLNVKGIMCMGPHVENEEEIENCFEKAYQLKEKLASKFGREHFSELSMGMSLDWRLALKHGSTMLRIGTILFE